MKSLEILVVEDTPSTQMLISRILESVGHRVRVASDGVQAIRLYNRVRPDLVIMDLQMPILDGFQTTSILRVMELDRHIPIIATTARRLTTDKERFLTAGVDAFLPKPFDAREFLDLVDLVVNRKAKSALLDGASLMSPAPKSVDPKKTMDLDATLERLGGDRKLLNDLVRFYFEDFPSILEDMRTSLARHDWLKLQRSAHSLKGLTANFSATPAQCVLQEIENLSLTQDVDRMTPLLANAEQELAILAGALAEFHSAETA